MHNNSERIPSWDNDNEHFSTVTYPLLCIITRVMLALRHESSLTQGSKIDNETLFTDTLCYLFKKHDYIYNGFLRYFDSDALL